MAKHRSHSIEFKRQVAQEFIAGETLHALSSRHDVSRNLIRIWVRKFEAGAFDDDAQAADLLQRGQNPFTDAFFHSAEAAARIFAVEPVAAVLLQRYEAKIAALERMVGRQALEIEFLKGALRSTPRPRSPSTSVITGPVAFPSPKDAD